MLFLQLVDGSHKLALLFLGQLIGGQMFAVKGTPCSFAADHRANTEQGTMGAKGDRFEPEGWTPKFKVIEVWNKAFPAA